MEEADLSEENKKKETNTLVRFSFDEDMSTLKTPQLKFLIVIVALAKWSFKALPCVGCSLPG